MSHTVLIAVHAFVATVCLPLGAVQLWRRPRGDLRHRRVGRVWALGMVFVAASSFWIRDLRDGRLSLLHVLSVVTLVSMVLGVAAIRRGDVRQHRAAMRGSWFGLVGAFVGAVAVPGRLLPTFAVDHPLGALAAVAAVAGCTLAVLALGSVQRGQRGPGGRGTTPGTVRLPA